MGVGDCRIPPTVGFLPLAAAVAVGLVPPTSLLAGAVVAGCLPLAVVVVPKTSVVVMMVALGLSQRRHQRPGNHEDRPQRRHQEQDHAIWSGSPWPVCAGDQKV